MNRHFLLVAMTTSVVFVASMFADAAEPAVTTISVKGMQCAACAGHVAESLQAIAGVEKAQADAAKATAIVTAKGNATPSPRALWEAIEKAGYTPVKLVAPSGTFTTKPKS
jgi:copper chaperone CopZ